MKLMLLPQDAGKVCELRPGMKVTLGRDELLGVSKFDPYCFSLTIGLGLIFENVNAFFWVAAKFRWGGEEK
jgi:hypothetical protein